MVKLKTAVSVLLAFVINLSGITIELKGGENPDLNLLPRFKILRSEIELSRDTNRNNYLDKIGRKGAVIGNEGGEFEVWVYPFKIVQQMGISVLMEELVTPLRGEELSKFIRVNPASTTITYSYESFTINQHIIVPIESPGAIILFEVETVKPITLIISFRPVLQPMWPASLGGQYSYWNSSEKAYVISESRGKYCALVGSPAGEPISSPPAHMLAELPNR
ncbi:MAG: hypothetical protein ACE5QV_08855, partial [Fidelibacterota bacterium]